MITKLICVTAMTLWASSAFALDSRAVKRADIPPDGTKAQKEICAAAMSAMYFSLAPNPVFELTEAERTSVESRALYWVSQAATANGMDVDTYFEKRLIDDIGQLQKLGIERWTGYTAQCLELTVTEGVAVE
ncbi:MAG: hypothetical protein QM645_09590 [Asticcacaulis sp.]